ncbi:hypothetical protein [Polaribacter porphyrae]|uniref:Uncharacterized protein n=1 Tax=Polaribacter porphyrae TaxID=1137780 RepID=A0A2S7WRS4_9FLAO|nr:hypothetical protein [Polaribacter porphyrae]PQJ80289.1 hypothetical protein BTO18_14365 [Polaribacter porphyrae]
MKKQQKTYILLIAVLFIWGAIGYQIYSRLNPPTPELNLTQVQSTFQKQKVVTQTHYEIKEEYRDPFLGKFPKKKKIIKRKKVNPKSKVIIPFPNVVYNGLVEGNKTKSYILTVNRKQEILKKGETHQGVKLISATKNEAVVQFQKQRKTIVKQ